MEQSENTPYLSTKSTDSYRHSLWCPKTIIIVISKSLITDHHNKYQYNNNNDLKRNIMRISKMWCESESHSVVSNSLQPHGLYSPWNSPGQNTGVGSLSLLQGYFPTQGLNPGLLHCRQIPYQLKHKESPRILEWVAYPFSSGYSQARNRTGVSCIAYRFFTIWAIRKVALTSTVIEQMFTPG